MKKLRYIMPAAILLVAGIAFAVGGDVGTLSAFGWRDIALICPVGALSTMLAGKMLIPRALVSLVLVVIAVLLFGRAFCAWVCPVPLVSSVRDVLARPSKGNRPARGAAGEQDGGLAASEDAAAAEATGEPKPAAGETRTVTASARATAPLTASEKRLLKGCGTRAERHGTFDSRHAVLAGGLLSAAIFGFPVVCLVCPIGLSFATIFLLIRAFGFGDPSWALLVVPAFLALEVVVFRKWCHWLCPVSALMSLVAKGNRTLRPAIDDSKCLETSRGVACGMCSKVCAEGIDVRHPQQGNSASECTRCRACAEVCPGQAITFPLIAPKGKEAGGELEAVAVTPSSSDAEAGQ